MNIRYILLPVAFISSSILCYDFASIAHQILHAFETQKIRSHFAKDLYENITSATNDFTTNLTYYDLEKHVDQVYLDYMATEIIKSNPNTYIALVWPVTEGNDQKITQIFNKYCNIICSKRILLNEQGARNFLNQIPSKASHPQGVNLWFAKPYINYNPMRIYLIEAKLDNTTNYDQMKDYLTHIFSNNRAFIEGFEKKYGKRAIQNLYVTTKCKREIRSAVKIEYAMHINDTPDETLSIGEIVFNENSIDCLRFSDPTKVKMLQNFNQYRSLLKSKLGTNTDQIVIYNSAVLSAYGLRDCNDIDFLHNPRIHIPINIHPKLSNQNQFFKRNYIILEDNKGQHYILEDIPHAFSDVNLDTSNSFKQKISIDELLYNPMFYFHFHGLKYATLDFMHYFKKKRGREKDLNDVQLIEKQFANRY